MNFDLNDDQRGLLYRQAQQAIARDVPYISLWYKTNVAVFQPEIRGVRLSPIAAFTFSISAAGGGGSRPSSHSPIVMLRSARRQERTAPFEMPRRSGWRRPE